MLKRLELRPEDMYELSPEQFERLVADRMEAMGCTVIRVGRSNEGDGGVDIVFLTKGGIPCRRMRTGETSSFGWKEDRSRHDSRIGGRDRNAQVSARSGRNEYDLHAGRDLGCRAREGDDPFEERTGLEAMD